MRCEFVTMALVISLGAAFTRAEDQKPTPIEVSEPSFTLEALVSETLEKNPELKFYEAEIDAAKGGRRTAGSFANPELGGGVGQKSIRGAGLDAEGTAWSVSLMQPFEWPGRIGLRKAIANQDIELAKLGLQRFKAALTGRVRVLAYELFAAQEKARAATEVADRFTALREVLLQRDPAGLTPLLESRVIEATELNSQRRATDALLASQTALLELNQIRGTAPDAQVLVKEARLSFRPPEDRETLLNLAQTNNFELRLRTVELTQQGFRVDLAKNERYPTVSVGPTFSQERAGDREQIIGVGVSIPLPLWNRNKGNIDSAVARQAQAQVSLNVTAREVQRKVLEAALTYETKRREMERWRPDSIQHFKEAATLADRHYRLGAVPIATYVELQKQYLDAVDGLLDTKKEVLAAAAQVEILTGLPLPLTSVLPVEGRK